MTEKKTTKRTTTRAYQPSEREGLKGESHGRAVLTDDVVMLARHLAREGVPITDIAKTAGVSIPTLWRAVTGQSWDHLPDAVPISHPRPRKSTTKKGKSRPK